MMQRYRVEFKLSMPRRSSWDGGWSGEGKNFAIVRELPSADLVKLFEPPDGVALATYRRVWTHRWSDGWIAQIVILASILAGV